TKMDRKEEALFTEICGLWQVKSTVNRLTDLENYGYLRGKESQLKAMKETVQLCLSTVFRDQQLPHLNPFRPYGTQISVPTMITDSRTAYVRTTAKDESVPPCTECDEEKKPENQMTDTEGTANREKKLL
ncbi:hypothetical protein FD755_011438, partial [Muntiacus reevesi]